MTKTGASLIAVAFVTACTQPGNQATDEVLAPSLGAVLTFGNTRLEGKLAWNAELRSGQLSDSLQLRATGRDAEGRIHSLDGTIELTGKGGWNGSSVVFSEAEDLKAGGKLGLVGYDRVKLTATAQEHQSAISFVPVEFDFAVSEQGTKIQGRIILHPETATLRELGRDPQLETELAIEGDVGLRTCTVFSVDQGPPGVPTAEHIVAANDPSCEARFSGP